MLKVDTDIYAPVLTNRTIVRSSSSHSTSYSSFDTYGNPGAITEAGPNGGNRTTTLTYYTDTGQWIVKQLLRGQDHQQRRHESLVGVVQLGISFHFHFKSETS